MKLATPLLLTLILPFCVSEAAAQPRPKETQTRTGTVSEVVHKGKSRTLIVDALTEELSFVISPKVNVEVKMTGADSSVLEKGYYLEGSGTLTNNRLFMDKALVRQVPPNAKVPASKMEKPETIQEGDSLNSQTISGLIVGRQTSQEYPEYEEMALKPAPNVPVIMFKKDLTVDVISHDLDDAQPGQAIEIEVIEGRNDKLTLVRATIDGGQYVPRDDEKPKKKGK